MQYFSVMGSSGNSFIWPKKKFLVDAGLVRKLQAYEIKYKPEDGHHLDYRRQLDLSME